MSTLVSTLVRIYTAFLERVLLRGSFSPLTAWRAFCTGSLTLGHRQQSFSDMSIYLTTLISWIFCNSSSIIERRPQRLPSGITMVGGCGSDRHVARSSIMHAIDYIISSLVLHVCCVGGRISSLPMCAGTIYESDASAVYQNREEATRRRSTL